MTLFQLFARISAGAGLCLLTTLAVAQNTAPVRLLVGYAAGGPVDAAARVFAPALAKELGVQVLVENRPGAGGAFAGEQVAKAAIDSNLLFFAASPTVTISPHIQKKMGFDPAKDLTPLAPLLTYANVLVVSAESPIKSLADMVAQAKANPGRLSYGSAGMGASNHLSGELLEHFIGAKLLHVPYKGNAPAMTDVIGGQITMMFDIVGTARNFISAGRVRALAVTSRERNRSLPDVPTLREAGVPDYEVVGWFAVYGPARMDPAQARRLSNAMNKVMAQEELRAQFATQGYDIWTGSPQALAAQQKSDFDMWAKVTKGITID